MGDDLLGMFQDLDTDRQDFRVRETYLRAPFKYIGSKKQEVPFLMQQIPYRDSYIEVFGGSAALLLARDRSKLEVYNDRHSGIVAFYRCLRDADKLGKLIDRLELTLHSREEFVWSKEQLALTTDDVERAALWYYTQVYSFAGKGMFYGRSTTTPTVTPALQDRFPLLKQLHQRLKHVQIENLDWRQCLQDFDSPGAVFYLDPPYYRAAGSVYSYMLSDTDHTEMCQRIMQMKAFVALSGFNNDLYNSFLWDKIVTLPIETGSSIEPASNNETSNPYQGNMDRGRGIREVLWIKESS